MKEEWCLGAPADFTLSEGEHIVITGENGSGKTKLVDMICGRHPLKSGSVEYSFPSPVSRYISDNIRYLEFRDCYGGETDRNYYHQQRWNQWDVQDRRILMSSGELRKYSLARALETKPCVLIIDSPFAGLDAASREILDARLREIAGVGRTHLVLVLSRTDEVPDYMTHVVTMKDGVAGRKVSMEEWKRGMDEPAPEIIRLNRVTVRYGERTILRDLDWVVRKGERWALSGANGSGKSTLLSLVCADNPQGYACDISLFGHRRGSGESIWDIKKHIGYVSPELHRAFRRDAEAVRIVANGLKDFHGMFTGASPEDLAVSLKWMERFGIGHLATRRFMSLSSGEQRLVLLARAFVRNPDLLILDEPLHGLDNQRRARVRGIIGEYCSDKEKTLVMVTHYEDELPDCIDHRLRLERQE